MAILRCPHCQFLKEVGNQHLGKTIPCPSCKKTAKVVDTVTLVKAAVDKFIQVNQTYKVTQQKLIQLEAKNKILIEAKNELQAQLDQLTTEHSTEFTIPNDLTQGYAFENTHYAAELNNFEPVIHWFKQRQIIVKPNAAAADISGYFDEMAVLLGDHLPILASILDGIRYRQRKGYDKFTIQLNEYEKKDRKIIKQFCQQGYDCAFFTKHHWHKGKNTIFLQLSDAPQIQHFFDGDWLEWYGLMKIATFFMSQSQKFACLRGAQIESAQQHEQNELDLFFLVNGKHPLWIECKSGEFRDSINKYQNLRKRLNIDPRYTILLVSGLEEDKANALSSMFKLTIVNESSLLSYLASLWNNYNE